MPRLRYSSSKRGRDLIGAGGAAVVGVAALAPSPPTLSAFHLPVRLRRSLCSWYRRCWHTICSCSSSTALQRAWATQPLPHKLRSRQSRQAAAAARSLCSSCTADGPSLLSRHLLLFVFPSPSSCCFLLNGACLHTFWCLWKRLLS